MFPFCFCVSCFGFVFRGRRTRDGPLSPVDSDCIRKVFASFGHHPNWPTDTTARRLIRKDKRIRKRETSRERRLENAATQDKSPPGEKAHGAAEAKASEPSQHFLRSVRKYHKT